MNDDPRQAEALARLSAKVQSLEELYTHQQRWMQLLDESIVEMRNDVARLRARCDLLVSRIDTAIALREEGEELPHEKPPHY